MIKEDWINNPKLKNVSPEKMEILLSLLDKSYGKKPEELVPFLISANTNLGQKGMSFTNEETELIIDILKENMTSLEKKRLEIIKDFMKKRH